MGYIYGVGGVLSNRRRPMHVYHPTRFDTGRETMHDCTECDANLYERDDANGIDEAIFVCRNCGHEEGYAV